MFRQQTRSIRTRKGSSEGAIHLLWQFCGKTSRKTVPEAVPGQSEVSA